MDTKFHDTMPNGGKSLAWQPHRARYLNGVVALAEALGLVLSGRDSALEFVVARHQGDLRAAVYDLLMGNARLPGVGPITRQRLNAALYLGQLLALQPLQEKPVMSSPGACEGFLQQHFSLHRREVFCCLFLDSRNRLIDCIDMFSGTIDGAAVYPREVLAEAMRLRANGVIVAHNHPSGTVNPSAADLRITERLRSALALVDIRLLDHIIVGHGQTYSMAQDCVGGFS